MTVETALILCPAGDGPSATERPMLGLTVGERLLLTLAKAGVRRIAFAGTGPRPFSPRARLEVVPLESASGNDPFLLVPADLVVDSSLVQSPEKLSQSLPLRLLPSSAWSGIAADPDRWLKDLGPGEAGSGRGFAVRVTDHSAAALAERSLIASLHKAADGVISRNLNRKISTAITRRLAPFRIRPNHVTVVVFLVGILSGPFALLGTYLGFAAGGFCYWFSAVLDGCDGELSRLKFMATPLGAWLDTVIDDLVGLSYITGMYVGLSSTAVHPYWTWIGIWAVTFYLLTLLPRYYIMAFRSVSGDYQKLAAETRPSEARGLGRVMLLLRDVVFRTDFLPFAAMVTALAGVVPVFAVPFAAGTVASCVDSWVTLAKPPKP